VDLHGRRVRAQQQIRRQVEGVVHVARRVVEREIQRLEVVVIVFDLGTEFDRKSHRNKDVFDLAQDKRNGMVGAGGGTNPRQGDVERFLSNGAINLSCRSSSARSATRASGLP
jgi:hypothetical protein